MKKLLLGAAVLTLILPSLALASEVKVGNSYYLNKGEVLSENLYAAGQNVFISGETLKDVVLGAGKIRIDGIVGGDALLAGGNIDALGIFKNDLRLAGGSLLISGTIDGDVAAAGGDIHVLPGAVINGDLFAAGGKILMEGKVNGNMRVATGDLTLGSQSFVGKNLHYTSTRQADIKSGATVVGETQFVKKDAKRMKGFFGAGALLKFLAFLAFGFVLFWLFRKKTKNAIVYGLGSFWKNVLTGFVVLVVAPILGIILLITLIGVPLGILFFLIYGFTAFLGCLMAFLFLGAWLQKVLLKKELEFNWQTIVIGAIIYLALGWLPILGWLVQFLFFLVAFGALLNLVYENFWLEK